MSEFKGTPGPWEFHGDDGEDNQIVVGDNGDVICVIGSYMTSIEEDFANGPLMAAAPELLEALKSARLVIDKLTTHGSTRTNCLQKIDFAIAKALGQ